MLTTIRSPRICSALGKNVPGSTSRMWRRPRIRPRITLVPPARLRHRGAFVLVKRIRVLAVLWQHGGGAILENQGKLMIRGVRDGRDTLALPAPAGRVVSPAFLATALAFRFPWNRRRPRRMTSAGRGVRTPIVSFRPTQRARCSRVHGGAATRPTADGAKCRRGKINWLWQFR